MARSTSFLMLPEQRELLPGRLSSDCQSPTQATVKQSFGTIAKTKAVRIPFIWLRWSSQV
jgi:hypothetical protein